jgi:hypothetical protein
MLQLISMYGGTNVQCLMSTISISIQLTNNALLKTIVL